MVRSLRVVLGALAFVATAVSPAPAQFATARPRPAKSPVTPQPPAASAGFLVGVDDCSQAHRTVPAGDQLGVVFVTGTTGAEGQNEALCYAFGTSGVDSDTWWDWTSTAAGNAALTTCGGTSVDTKVAVWPGTAGCPADGTALACNDDACGFQSTAVWSATAGSSYTFQLGTFPGAAGGSGTFDLQVSSPGPSCPNADDGTTENATGLSAGGETGWMHYVDCLGGIDEVSTAYGTPGGTLPLDGLPSLLCVFQDAGCDADPTTGPAVLLWSVSTTVTNAQTDIFNDYPTGGVSGSGIGDCYWVMATVVHDPGQLPAPMDETNPTPRAWIVGSSPTSARLDLADLNNNSAPPVPAETVVPATAWLLRADGPPKGTPYPFSCFGDSGCPCGNDGDGAGGCENSTAQGGPSSRRRGSPASGRTR